jgi:hypothetical protein
VNITDPHQSFTGSEWEALGTTGCAKVMAM